MRSRLALLLAVALVPLSIQAAPWDEPFTGTPDAIRKAADAIEKPKDQDVDLLLEDHLISFDEQGRQTETFRRVYRVHTTAAVESWGETSAAWSPWYQQRPELRVRVIDPHGQVKELDPKTLSESAEDPEWAMYSDRKVLRAPIPGLMPGAIVEEQVVTRDRSPFFEAGLSQRLGLFASTPVARTRIRLEAPLSLPLKYELRADGFNEKVSTENGRRIVELTRGPVKADKYEFESDAAPDILSYAHLDYATGRSWAEVATKYAQRVDERIGKLDRRALAKEITEGARTRDERIQKVLAWVGKKTRYTGLELGEASIIPVAPEETLSRGYGDCKDLSTLVVALLRASGIPAHVAVLRTRSGDISEKLPGLGLQDHAIVAVPAHGKDRARWLDPTDPALRATEIPSWLQGRPALVAVTGTRGLVRLPELTSADTRAVTDRVFEFQAFGPLRATEHRFVTGAIATDYRRTRAREDGIKDLITGWCDSFYSTKELSDLTFSKETDDARGFELSFTVPKTEIATTTWSEASISFARGLPFSWVPGSLKPSDDKKPEPRKSDLVLPYAHQAEMRFKLVPPSGFQLRGELPEKEDLSLGPAKFTARYQQQKDGAVLVTFALDTVKRRYSPAEVDAFRTAYKELSDRAAVKIAFFSEAQAQLDAGHPKEALEVFRKELARSPKSGIWHARFAGALGELGMGELGRRMGKKGAELAPDDYLSWTTLGWILERDVYGRPYGAGYDRKGAIAAYRKAIALNPSLTTARSDLASLLARNDDDEIFGPGSDFDGAAEQYAYLLETLHQSTAASGLLGTLYSAKKYDEVLTRAPKLEDSEYRNGVWIAAVAMKKNAQAAIAEAEKVFGDLSVRRKALFAAGSYVMRERRYGDAAALIKEGQRGTVDPKSAQLARMLESMKPWESFKFAKDDPRSLVLKMIHAGFDPKEDFASLFVKHGLIRVSDGDVQAFGRVFTEKFGAMDRAQRQIVLDTSANLLQVKTEGDPKRMLRVELDGEGFPGGTKTQMFARVEDGEVRMVAACEVPEPLGWEALTAAEHGDLEHARKWLDWVADCAKEKPNIRLTLFKEVWADMKVRNAEEIKRAAALVLTGLSPKAAAKARPILTAWEKTADEQNKEHLGYAIGEASLTANQPKDALAWSERLLKATPDSFSGFFLKYRALHALKSPADAYEALADARLAAKPDDPFALSTKYEAAILRGDLSEAIRRNAQLIEVDRSNPAAFNNHAWDMVAAGTVNEEAVSHAERAVTLTQQQDKGSLNTLAAVYAAQGRTQDALPVLVASIDDESPKQVEATELVRGMLAEDYGLTEEAIRLYRSIQRPDEPKVNSTWSIAQSRLKALTSPEGALPVSSDQVR